ncbi:TetR/AcrR family transcriptional regulator [Pseudoruegeria sp. SK021]|uniref:TetR/AcrR family transcriptional regulator n=1 Tax=Pseudoruegeria sp. SK021 TaxID=1933035 RepID=UPI000A230CF5|nr:TetR/AcrR family transcriptional regulator [Pseudoruegeria sp. SK021]OSP54586.1 TetR family transcriptional regulator [Pseudoruegeria sp. SK021]
MADAKKPGRKRDATASRKAILDAALIEFSEQGYAGARVDEVARAAGVSKPLIYGYFGDKDALYAAALREAYVQIRENEKSLDLDGKSPDQAIRLLVIFTLKHFRDNPWFISMLNTENLRGGATIREIEDASDIQSNLVGKLRVILRKGAQDGSFRDGIDPVDLYVFIASLCYFPVSNIHTLRAVFKCAIDDEWLDQRGEEAARMLLAYLRPGA